MNTGEGGEEGGDAGSGARILDGVRVVDCSEGIAGPVAALLLAEAGADVIKVEPPDGDRSRASQGFLTWNRSKRSVVLDLRTESGRDQLGHLLAGADVLIHGFGPTAAGELGLTDDQLGRPPSPTDHLRRPGMAGRSPQRRRPDRRPLGHRPARVVRRAAGPSGRSGLPPVPLRQLVRGLPLDHRDPGPADPTAARRGRRRAGPHQHGPGCAGADHDALGPGRDARSHVRLRAAQGPACPRCSNAATACGSTSCAAPTPTRPSWSEALADLGEEGVAEANAAFTGLQHAGLSQLRRQPGGLPHPAQPAVAGRLLGPRHPGPGGGALRRHPGRRAGPAERVRDRGGRPRAGTHHPGRDAVLDRPTVAGDPARACTGRSTPRRCSTPPGHGRPTQPQRGRPTQPTHPTHPLPSRCARPSRGCGCSTSGTSWPARSVPCCSPTSGPTWSRSKRRPGTRCDPSSGSSPPASGASGAWPWTSSRRPPVRPSRPWCVGPTWSTTTCACPPPVALGLDYDSMRAINPEVVYCHASSYGPEGERADWPGYDQLFQAAAGWEVLGGGEGNDPMWFRFGFMDHLCAMASVVATLLAVWHRDRTGRGQRVTGSLLGGGVLTNSETFLKDGDLAVSAAPLDHEQMGLSAGYRLYALADGWIALCARDDAELAAACTTLGAAGPDGIGARLAGRRCEDALRDLGAEGVPCEPVGLDQGEAFLDDALHRALGLVTSYPHAEWGRARAGRGPLGPRRPRGQSRPGAAGAGRAHPGGPLRGGPGRGRRSPSCSPSP